MAKGAVSVGAVLLVLALVMAGSARAGQTGGLGVPYTIACQGLDAGLTGTGLGLGSDAALWSVVVAQGSKLTSGKSTTMYTNAPGASGSSALTCNYYLDSTSTTSIINGAVAQTLIWDPVTTPANPGGCSSQFTDHVYLNTNGTTAAMIDDNLDDDNVAGSGTCNISGVFILP